MLKRSNSFEINNGQPDIAIVRKSIIIHNAQVRAISIHFAPHACL